MALIDELKRRNVLRVAAAYIAGGWLPFIKSIGQTPEQLAEVEFNVFAPGHDPG